jgi:hypothetical protein
MLVEAPTQAGDVLGLDVHLDHLAGHVDVADRGARPHISRPEDVRGPGQQFDEQTRPVWSSPA